MSDELKYVWCTQCGNNFPMRQDVYDSFEECGNTFYCPQGHSLMISRESIVKWSRATDIRARRYRNRADRLAKSLASLRGVQTRHLNRLLRGDCPYCGESAFVVAQHSDLAGHIRDHHNPKRK